MRGAHDVPAQRALAEHVSAVVDKHGHIRTHAEAPRDFTAHFDQHVTPDLEAMIGGYACFVRLGTCDYADALGHVLQYAWRRAAYLLDDAQLGQLQDWIGTTLATAIGDL